MTENGQPAPGLFPYANQAGLNRLNPLRPGERPCRVEEISKILPDGKIACLGVGPIECTPDDIRNYTTTLRIAETTCLAFQKVDLGIVNALLPTDQFIPVNWADRPTAPRVEPPDGPSPPHRYQYLHNEIELDQGLQGDVPLEWQDFTDVMAAAKQCMLNHMRIPIRDPQNPDMILRHQAVSTLFEGFENGAWDSPHTSFTGKGMLIQDDIRALNQFADINPAIDDWIDAACANMTTNAGYLRNLLLFLFPDRFDRRTTARNKNILISPSKESTDISVASSVAHCLVYGYHEDQEDPPLVRGRPRDRAPINHRVALRKQQSRSRSRSRSRSPIRDYEHRQTLHTGTLVDDTEHLHTGFRPQNERDVLDHPGEYIMTPTEHLQYFECHQPDLMVVETRLVPSLDPGFPQREETRVKVVAVLSSALKFSTSILEQLLIKSTEQCVLSCLSSMGHNQDLILGLVVVADGFKLIKVERQQNQGNHFYEISETDLIVWDNQNAMYGLFRIIENIL